MNFIKVKFKTRNLILLGIFWIIVFFSGCKVPGMEVNIDEESKPILEKSISPYDGDYYSDAVGKKGEELKKALNKIISNHRELSYKEVWEALRDTDQDPNNPENIILLYTGISVNKNDNGALEDQWNREHVWAKSHGGFGTKKGAGTDLHHIRPTDVSVNSRRGNLDFDEGGETDIEAVLCRYDEDSWEPRDSIKGDVARMIFYMATRYEGENGEFDLEVNNEVNNGSKPYHGKLSILLKWHMVDPVDSWELRRNDIIFEKYQYNRNPFIDHPEWINAIWDANL